MNALQLKHPRGWFAAGGEWRQALHRLSDGAFKLFVFVSLEAERASGRLAFRQAQLARTLGKSRRSIGTYLRELEDQGVCRRFSAPNQHADGILEVSEAYWPYLRPHAGADADPQERSYLEAVRRYLRDQPCVRFALTAANLRLAQQWFHHELPLLLVEQAILTGCGRKYVSWLNGQLGEPIGSLHYFTPILQELASLPLPPQYCAFNRLQVERFQQRWLRTQSPPAALNRTGACANFAQALTPKTTETR
jgi:hypothetical protein